MKSYLNMNSPVGSSMALVPLLFIAALAFLWLGHAASAGASTEVSVMDRQQPVHFETATFALG